MKPLLPLDPVAAAANVSPSMSAAERPSSAPVWLSLLVPGLGHVLLGQTRIAVAAFVACAALFFAGYAMVGDRLFYFALLSFDRDGMAAQIVRFVPVFNLPESLGLVFASLGTVVGFEPGFMAERRWEMPRDLEHIGAFLTAASGMLSAFFAADVAWRLRAQAAQAAAPEGATMPAAGISPALAAAASWLVPGWGHVLAGQKSKGLLVGAAVVAVFAMGMVASQGHALDRGIAPIWWIGQNLFGGGSLFAALVTAPSQFSSYPPGYDMGVIFCTVAALMNLVVMVDAFTVVERRRLGLPMLGAEVHA